MDEGARVQNFRLDGLPIAVTGAAGLLGRNHASAIANAGGIPILLDVDNAGLESLEFSLLRGGFECGSFQIDSTDEQAVSLLATKVLNEFGPLYGIVNNVASNPKMIGSQQGFGQLDTTSLAQWSKDHDVSLSSAFLMAKYFGPQLAQRGEGSIVNIASDLAIISPDQRIYEIEGLSPRLQPKKPMSYSSTKSALLGINRYLSTYWAPIPVRSNALVPGPVLAGQAAELRRSLESRIPLARLASPDEYGGALVFLLSSASSYMNGASLVMDGGRSVW